MTGDEHILCVPLEFTKGTNCPIAQSNACIDFCPLWSVCECDNSPWRTEDDEDISSNNTDE